MSRVDGHDLDVSVTFSTQVLLTPAGDNVSIPLTVAETPNPEP